MRGSCKKLRYEVLLYNNKTKKWVFSGKYCNLHQIAEEYDISYGTCQNLLKGKKGTNSKFIEITKLNPED